MALPVWLVYVLAVVLFVQNAVLIGLFNKIHGGNVTDELGFRNVIEGMLHIQFANVLCFLILGFWWLAAISFILVFGIRYGFYRMAESDVPFNDIPKWPHIVGRIFAIVVMIVAIAMAHFTLRGYSHDHINSMFVAEAPQVERN